MTNKDTIVRRMAHTPALLRIREREDGSPSRTITGRAILFDTPSDPLWEDVNEVAREVIAPTAVTRELLDGCDIKMTMFHDRELILARSRNGRGTLSYTVDAEGVSFEFEAPDTVDGDKALELVRRGDLAGCSFAFSTNYYDRNYVSVETARRDGRTEITYTVRVITGVYDFTLAADPAYPDTTVEAEQRELATELRRGTDIPADPEPEPEQPDPAKDTAMREQWRRMRMQAARKISEIS